MTSLIRHIIDFFIISIHRDIFDSFFKSWHWHILFSMLDLYIISRHFLNGDVFYFLLLHPIDITFFYGDSFVTDFGTRSCYIYI